MSECEAANTSHQLTDVVSTAMSNVWLRSGIPYALTFLSVAFTRRTADIRGGESFCTQARTHLSLREIQTSCNASVDNNNVFLPEPDEALRHHQAVCRKRMSCIYGKGRK